MNDAFDKGYIYDKFTLNRNLRLPARPSKRIETITSEEFEEAIGKANDIYDYKKCNYNRYYKGFIG